MAGIGKQAKVISQDQLRALLAWLKQRRNAERNRLVVLLSFKAGLRAKEISSLKWAMVLNANGGVGSHIHLTNDASKGESGRIIPLNSELRQLLVHHKSGLAVRADADGFVITSERSDSVSAQVIVNLFADWYERLGFVGCSSHSGRRTFITNAARRVSSVGGSLRDVQALAGHASLQTTARYIATDNQAQAKLVNLI
ncbi:site-specific integrase [Xanthobacteraceae bacterium Astr-EGSB]|uniref:tyrosine-type recombinase/integrase n=1 Tax=Astrobacterium formosum TaxID=3069710 RepID=UPI0027B0A60C|nr:site-specific integrase [Xanthobacteraceae bacterium Astr-EGSB]